MMGNTTLLMVVVATAALLVACILAVVAYKTRTRARGSEAQTTHEKAELRALEDVHQDALDNDDTATAYAAQVEVDLRMPADG